MYLAQFETDSTKWVQGLVSFPLVGISKVQQGTKWGELLEIVVRALLGSPDVLVSFRLGLSANRLHRAILVTAPAESEATLRKCIGAFTRLDCVIEDSIIIPQARDEHDALLGSFPKKQCQLRMPSYTVGNSWLACDFRIWLHLEKIFLNVSLSAEAVSYQVNFARLATPRSRVLEIMSNSLSLRDCPGIPNALTEYQERLAGRVTRAPYMCEEFLGVTTSIEAEQIEAILKAQFRKSFGIYNFEPPDFEFDDDKYENNVVGGMHSGIFSDLTSDEICHSATTEEEVVAVLTMEPRIGSMNIGNWMPLRESVNAEEMVREYPSTLPAPCEDSGIRVFVSYKRTEAGVIGSVLEIMGKLRCKFWYDKGIPGGTEWDSIIESKIAESRVLIVCLTNHTLDSKYVRREVKFADSLDKPILAIKFEDVQPNFGMRMLLSQYQMIDRREQDFPHSLEKALTYWRAIQ